MVKCYPGGTVSIIVRGQALSEYQVTEHFDDGVTTYHCYIEALDGEEYAIDIDGFPMKKRCKYEGTAIVDGREAAHLLQCAPDDDATREASILSSTLEGSCATNRNGNGVIRAFAFNRIGTTDDEVAAKASSKQLRDFGTIRVELTLTFRSGRRRHKERKIDYFECDLPADPIAHVDSKAAVYGVSTGYGQELDEIESFIECSCRPDYSIPEEKIVVIFRYLPHEWLVLKGLKCLPQYEEDNSSDGFEIDVERTQESAEQLSIRRAQRRTANVVGCGDLIKTEASSSLDQNDGGHQQPESQADREVKVEAKRAIFDSVDLTGEGDFVLPSRKAGETIIIEDD